MRKVLWVVDTSDVDGLVQKANYIRAQALCIRTTNNWLKDALPNLKHQGFDVYGWRWPSVDPQENSNHHYAKDEADYALRLIEAGLDGYIVDPESDDGRTSDDWNDPRFSNLAHDFCSKIKIAGRQSNQYFLFGLTSGGNYPTAKPLIPWAVFLAYSDAAFPQIYWAPNYLHPPRRSPDEAFTVDMESWKTVLPATFRVCPIAGEIASNEAAQIERFGEIVRQHGMTEVHFYAYENGIGDDNWLAIRNFDVNIA
jgi:hypothetical protein